MATGIPNKNQSSTMPTDISLNYCEKKYKKQILSGKHSQYNVVWANDDNTQNKLFFGDNLDALLYLLDNGYKERINLIYIDPPYSTSCAFLNKKQEVAYNDNLVGYEYIEFLRERIIVLYELLSKTGSFYIHLDERMIFPMKLILDEIFGTNNFRAFITRKKCSTKNTTYSTYGDISDYILFYTKSKQYTWNRPYISWTNEKILEQYPCVEEDTGRRFKKVPIHAPGVRNGETGKMWRGLMPPTGKHWQYTPAKLDELDAAGEIVWSKNGNPRRKVYFDEQKGIPIQNIWLDYQDFINQSQKSSGYPTEKNFDMLKMIVSSSSNEGDLVLDCFVGSGTTLEAADKLGRTWIGIDNSKESIKTTSTRMLHGCLPYGDYVTEKTTNIQSINTNHHFQIFAEEDKKSDLLDYCDFK